MLRYVADFCGLNVFVGFDFSLYCCVGLVVTVRDLRFCTGVLVGVI